MKNIKNSKITKTLMYLIAIASMVVMLTSGSNLFVIIDSYIGGGNQHGARLIQAYDEDNGTEYYKPFVNTQQALTNNIDTIADIEMIIEDNMEHSVHELLGINIDENIDSGVRYVLYLDNKIIGTDGITDGNNYYNSNNETVQNSYFTINGSVDNLPVSVENPTYNTLDRYISEDGNYYIQMQLKVFYEGPVADSINARARGLENENEFYLITLGISILVFLLTCLYFTLNAGKRNDEDGIYFNSFDRVYIDFKAIFIIIALIFMAFGYVLVTNGLGKENANYYCVIIAPIVTFMIIDFCSNFGKKVRVRKFWESISIVAFSKFVLNKIVKPLAQFMFVDASVSLKIITVLLVFITFLGFISYDFSIAYIFLLPITILLIINSVRLVNAMGKVKNGRSYKAQNSFLNIPYNSAFVDLEEISGNMVKVYKEGETAQKVKTELISNVSHDLRTPLTAIIGYVDLLEKKQDGFDDETNEYIRVLREKSDRMNTMVEDLFDLAKSANNDVQMNFEKLNVKKLVEQSLSELDDVVSDEKIIKRLDESLNISADGNKMYRVMQNLIENAVKYSFEGTRIYIDCYANENIVYVEFKNIANYQMDFTPDEIIQRFNRGDKSRTTKGSGLGLSIAKTYTNLNNGDFKVDVDGDMFKVTLVFDRVE